MPRTVLITVSGMVGSGKTTVVEQAAAVLERAGLPFERWRFQRLPCITFRRTKPPSGKKAPTEKSVASTQAMRGTNYRRQRLSALAAAGHLARIVAFRVYTKRRNGPRFAIVNRYFYDSFAHFDVAHAPTRRYARLLARLVPKPDVAMVLGASPATIAARRPNYAPGYLERVAQAYDALPRTFPDVLRISSDDGAPTQQQVEATLLRSVKAISGGPAPG